MIAIIDYEAGNLTSVQRAVEHLGARPVVTQDPAVVAEAQRVIFPGVGAAGAAMANLRRMGLDRALIQAVEQGKPVLGICIGIQILLEHSQEDGGVDCLGLIPGEARRFPAPHVDAQGHALKVPHMGWNQVRFLVDHPLFVGLDPEAEFYFVHSYYPVPAHERHIAGVSDYGFSFCAAVIKDNLAATQFHLEKSGRAGLRILDNFLSWRPEGGERC